MLFTRPRRGIFFHSSQWIFVGSRHRKSEGIFPLLPSGLENIHSDLIFSIPSHRMATNRGCCYCSFRESLSDSSTVPSPPETTGKEHLITSRHRACRWISRPLARCRIVSPAHHRIGPPLQATTESCAITAPFAHTPSR